MHTTSANAIASNETMRAVQTLGLNDEGNLQSGALPAGVLSFQAVRAMAEDVVYADLNIPEARLHYSSQPHNFCQCPHWHQPILKIGAAGYVVLLVAVTVLSALVFQGSSDSGVISEDASVSDRNESKCISCLENLTHLKKYLCDPAQSCSAEGAKCMLCPPGWMPHKGKCYWVSKEIKKWTSSKDDCLTKGSHLLVTQDPDELGYIQNITTEKNSLWIGVNFTSPKGTWMWVDGSPFSEKLFPSKKPDKSDCGVLKNNQIAWEMCSDELKWICEKKGLLI